MNRLINLKNKLERAYTRTVNRQYASDMRGPVASSDSQTVEDYWTEHNVTLHRRFASAAESLADFHWRNAQYFGYIELMPVNQADELTVLDLGCGPGYDLVGFATQSKTKRLIGVDISSSSLAEARDRLALHDSHPELLHHDVMVSPLPIETASIDLVHCSGVMHHMTDMNKAFSEIRRVLKPNGTAQLMVYHADSLWLHLYVAYERQLLQSIDSELDLESAFRKSTDGPDCPISRCFTEQQFVRAATEFGFQQQAFGSAISAFEMSLIGKRFGAIMDKRLSARSREFLSGLTFDDRQLPLTRPGVYAGIDGCYRFKST